MKLSFSSMVSTIVVLSFNTETLAATCSGGIGAAVLTEKNWSARSDFCDNAMARTNNGHGSTTWAYWWSNDRGAQEIMYISASLNGGSASYCYDALENIFNQCIKGKSGHKGAWSWGNQDYKYEQLRSDNPPDGSTKCTLGRWLCSGIKRAQ